MRRVIIYSFLAVILFTSCSTAKISHGKYYDKNHSEYFELKENREFTYLHRSGGFMRYSNGYWNMDKETNKFFLKSKIQNMLNIPMSVNASVYGSHVSFIFPNLIDSYNSLSKIKWEVYINNKAYSIQNKEKISFVIIDEPIEVDSFYIQAIRDNRNISSSPDISIIRSEVYKVSDSRFNCFKVIFAEKLDSDIFCYIPINDTFLLGNDYFVWKRTKNDNKIYNIKYKLEH